MKYIFTKIILIVLAVFLLNCSKSSSSNSDGIPLVPDSGGQVGFTSTGTVTILDGLVVQPPNGGGGGPSTTVPSETFSIINVPISGIITDKNKLIVEVNLNHSVQFF